MVTGREFEGFQLCADGPGAVCSLLGEDLTHQGLWGRAGAPSQTPALGPASILLLCCSSGASWAVSHGKPNTSMHRDHQCGGPFFPENGQQITWEDIQELWGHWAVWSDLTLSGQVPSFLKAIEGSEKANIHQNKANYISWKSHLQEQQMTFWDRQMGRASAGDKFPKRMITQPSKMTLL